MTMNQRLLEEGEAQTNEAVSLPAGRRVWINGLLTLCLASLCGVACLSWQPSQHWEVPSVASGSVDFLSLSSSAPEAAKEQDPQSGPGLEEKLEKARKALSHSWPIQELHQAIPPKEVYDFLNSDVKHGQWVPYGLRLLWDHFQWYLGVLYTYIGNYLGADPAFIVFGLAIPSQRDKSDAADLPPPDLEPTWREQKDRVGWSSDCKAYVAALLRFVFWHLFQPLWYISAFYACSDQLGIVEFGCGSMVLLKELVYVAALFIVVFRDPAAFLFNCYYASHEYWAIFFLMPEIFILTTLGRSGMRTLFLRGFCVLATWCGLISLAVQLHNGHIWGPLCAGYIVNAMAAPASLLLPCLPRLGERLLKHSTQQLQDASLDEEKKEQLLEDALRRIRANISLINEPLHGGERALHLACEWGRRKDAQDLLNMGAEVNLQDYGGFTPLHQAARGGQEPCARLLLEHRADVNIKDDSGQTPLHYCARYGYKPCAQLLLQHRAEVNLKGTWGDTPLHLAAWGGKEPCARLFLEHRADVNIKNNGGYTARDVARGDCVNLLRQYR